MTQPTDRFEDYSKALQDVIRQGTDMTVAAAKRADADDFGIDARISTAHQFVDMEVKGHAKLLETLIKGPWVPVVSSTPMDSDPINVRPEPYPRTIEPIAPGGGSVIPSDILADPLDQASTGAARDVASSESASRTTTTPAPTTGGSCF